MPNVNLRQSLGQFMIPTLSLGYQQKLRKIWNERINDDLAFVPHTERATVTPEEAERRNAELGSRASGYLRNTIQGITPVQGSILAAVGFGKGHDSLWLETAVSAGFTACCIDISDEACKFARQSFEKQSQGWGHSFNPLPYSIIQGEIQSILADPSSVGLDIDKVQLWYFCRSLGCFSRRSAKLVLQQIGLEALSGQANEDFQRTVVIINTFKDYNPNLVGKTTTLWTKKAVLKSLEEGAGRSVQVVNEEMFPYYSQTVLAMTIQSTNG